MIKRSFPKYLLVLIIFIGVVNELANIFSLYWRIPWFDMPMHFLGGLWIGLTSLWLCSSCDSAKSLKIFTVSFLAVIIVGVLWEVFEFSIDTFLVVSSQNNTLDTISDMMFDILGGVMAAVYFIFKKQ